MNEIQLVDETAQLLPEREALGVIDIATIVGTNTALAVNAGGLGTNATAAATQVISVTQS